MGGVPLKKFEHSMKDYKDYVMAHLKAGDRIRARSDTYTTDTDHGHKHVKDVVELGPHFIRTLDSLGRPETFNYFEVYKIITKPGGIVVEEELTERERKMKEWEDELEQYLHP